jgi:hypothetical protein
MCRAASIHIGVDRPGGPGDTRALLQDSESAAWRMAELAYQAGYDSILVLRGATATVNAVQAALFNATQLLEKGDLLLVSYSGHGGQQRNVMDLERDATDESWSLHDGELLDDTLAGWWRQFRPGVRIVMVSESCFSGGMDRGGYDNAPPHWRRRHRMRRMRSAYRDASAATPSCIVSAPRDCAEIRATVLMLSASREHQPAEGRLFTDCLLEVWDKGNFPGSYCELYGKVKERVMSRRTSQHPQILMLGTPDPQFPLEPAFRRAARQADPQEPGLSEAGRRETSPSGGEPHDAERDEPGPHAGRRDRPVVYRGGYR